MATIVKIPDDELNDFFSEAMKLGFLPKQFMAIASESVPVEPGPITRVVVVTRQQNNGSKHRYQYIGATWVIDAISDLKSGSFGKP